MGLKTIVVCDRCGAETDDKYFRMEIGTEKYANNNKDIFLCHDCFAGFEKYMKERGKYHE